MKLTTMPLPTPNPVHTITAGQARVQLSGGSFTLAGLATAVVLSTLSLPALAETVSPGGKQIGVGIELGAPTNINVKLMTASDQGVVIGVGGGIWYDASLSLHVDYLWHPLVAQFSGGSLSGFIGGGGWASIGYPGKHYGYYRPFYDDGYASFGARLPLGVSLAFNEVPVELFAEVVPSVALFPGIGVFGQGGFGGRIYF
ncbi:MAG: DUF3996 domain-containing protein [Deltaproteobacteria bacterium]|nr:DUF3996 domain-containing protein [Deltaproteobacteria bacterium]